MTRPIGCLLVLLPFLLIAAACAPVVLGHPAPSLDRDRVTALLVAAEIARADAFASADPRSLRPLFSDSAIAGFLPELARLRQRGKRIEERVDTRRLVHWASAAGRGEGVLEMIGEQRVGLSAGPPRGWCRILRQWWSVLGWTGGRWLVVRSADLSPNQWWQS